MRRPLDVQKLNISWQAALCQGRCQFPNAILIPGLEERSEMSLQKLCLGSQTSQGIDFDCLKIENNDSADNINGNHSELILSEMVAAVLECRKGNLDGGEGRGQVRRLQQGQTRNHDVNHPGICKGWCGGGEREGSGGGVLWRLCGGRGAVRLRRGRRSHLHCRGRRVARVHRQRPLRRISRDSGASLGTAAAVQLRLLLQDFSYFNVCFASSPFFGSSIKVTKKVAVGMFSEANTWQPGLPKGHGDHEHQFRGSRPDLRLPHRRHYGIQHCTVDF